MMKVGRRLGLDWAEGSMKVRGRLGLDWAEGSNSLGRARAMETASSLFQKEINP